MNAAKAKEISELIINILKSPEIIIETTKTAPMPHMDLFKNIILPVAIFSNIIAFIISIPFASTNMLPNLISIIVFLAIGLGFLFIGAHIFNFLAPKFKGISNLDKAFSALALPSLPYYILTIISPLPIIGGLVALIGSIYIIYLTYKFTTDLMEVSEKSRLPYFCIAFGAEILLLIMLSSTVLPILFSVD